MPVTLIARFTALPEFSEKVTRLIADYAAHVVASDGCHFFVPTVSTDAPNHFVILEQYENDAAFQAHLADPENAVFNAALKPWAIGPSELEMLHVVP